MKKFLLTAFVFATLQSIAQSNETLTIKKLLAEQTVAWNRGDIEGFMKAYWENDSLLFIGSNGITYGWKNTLDHYKKSYPDTSAMGKLTFTVLHTKQLSPGYFHVIGKWHLQRTAGNAAGYFTLMWKKIKGKWLIIADHSS